jgi:hypothetical protein
MSTEEKTEKNFVKSVSEIYQSLQLYKNLTILAVAANMLLAIAVNGLLLAEPIVIMYKGAEKLSFIGEKKEVVVNEAEIKGLVEKFIKKRYEWETFTVDNVIDNINPIVTSGLREKISTEISKQAESYKAISQYVGKVQITVDANGNVIGVFDKILRISDSLKNSAKILPSMNKIPLLSEAQILVKVVRGNITDENPLGIYINSVVNYEPN